MDSKNDSPTQLGFTQLLATHFEGLSESDSLSKSENSPSANNMVAKQHQDWDK